MKEKKNMKAKKTVQKPRKQESDKTPTYLLILIALLVLIAFAVITISSNMKSQDKSVIDDIKESIDYKSELILPSKGVSEYQKLINAELMEVKKLNEEILNRKFI